VVQDLSLLGVQAVAQVEDVLLFLVDDLAQRQELALLGEGGRLVEPLARLLQLLAQGLPLLLQRLDARLQLRRSRLEETGAPNGRSWAPRAGKARSCASARASPSCTESSYSISSGEGGTSGMSICGSMGSAPISAPSCAWGALPIGPPISPRIGASGSSSGSEGAGASVRIGPGAGTGSGGGGTLSGPSVSPDR
jgi:hypothetical protein